MKIIVGSEHAGNDYRIKLCEWLREHYEVEEVAEIPGKRTGYSPVAESVAQKVLEQPDRLGILICGTGIGMCMAAGKVPGIRAALCTNSYMGKMARMHNNANVIIFGSRVIAFEHMKEILITFLHSEYEGGRHEARLHQLEELDSKYRRCDGR